VTNPPAADLDLEIPLERPYLQHLMLIVLTAGLGIAALLVPRRPGRGANLGPGIHLSDDSAAIVIPLLASLLILVGVFFVFSLIMLSRRPRFCIRASSKWLEVPGPAWAPDLQRVDWSRVLDVSCDASGAVTLTLERGRTTWPRSWFGSARAAAEAYSSLKERMGIEHRRIGKKLA
jgi:hypothetical protein